MSTSKWAWDLVTGEDWGHGFDEQSGYEYDSPQGALAAAIKRMRAGNYDPDMSGITLHEEGNEDGGYTWNTQNPYRLWGATSVVPDIELEGGAG